MMKKFPCQILVFLLLFLTWWDTQKYILLKTSGTISTTLPVFPAIQIDLLKNKDPQVVQDALKGTMKPLLEYLVPDLTNEPWQADFIFVNLLGDPEPEIALSLSLAPDIGILTCLQKQQDHYILLYYIDDLLPLIKIDKLPFTQKRDILFTREDHNERTGAFTEAQIVKIWGWKEKDLQVLWEDNTFWELNWYSNWDTQKMKNLDKEGSDPYWIKLLHNSTILYRETESPSLLVKSNQAYYQASSQSPTLPPEQSFELIAERTLEEEFQWQDKWGLFVLKKEIQPPPNLPSFAIIKDMENHLDSLIQADRRYKIITEKGEVLFINKDLLR